MRASGRFSFSRKSTRPGKTPPANAAIARSRVGSISRRWPVRTTRGSYLKKRAHYRKPDEIYDIIEACSPGPYLELFARFCRNGWMQWGNEDVEHNTKQNVAHRKGHVEPQPRLLESPRGYRGK